MDFFEELQWRGLIKDVTSKEKLIERLKTPIVLYCGFDPTADSLHIGHLQQLMLLKRYQAQGHHPLAVIGGGTGMIGDPRPTSERKLLSEAELQANYDALSQQITAILSSDHNPVKTINNKDWLGELSLLDYLRDYGKYFSVSNMIAKDTIARRLETGISYTEFSYTILQAIDFLELYRRERCEMQIGGSDQWGNLVSGTDLIRKVNGAEVTAFGVTSELITKADGTKFGKSEGDNIWLDERKTDPYTFYQYWINTSDNDIMNFMKRLSMKSVAEIMAIETEFSQNPHLRHAQKELAKELTQLCFGSEGLDTALRLTDALFSGDIQNLSAAQIKTIFKENQVHTLEHDGTIVDVLVATGVVPSRREARQLIQSGAIRVNGIVIQDLEFIIEKEQAIGKELTVIRRGKKTYHLLSHVL